MKTRVIRMLADERVRFLLVGSFNTVFAYLLFIGFEYAFGGRYFVSLVLSYLIATLVAFGLHRRFTFRVSGREGLIVDFLRFESVYVVMFIVNAALLPLFIEIAGWPSFFAQAVIVLVTTVGSYLAHKFFTFTRRPSSREKPPPVR